MLRTGKKSANGRAYFCTIRGKLGRSEEPSQQFMVTGEGRELSSLEGESKEVPRNEVRIAVDLREENFFLEGIPPGSEIVWTEIRGISESDFVRSCAIKVVSKP